MTDHARLHKRLSRHIGTLSMSRNCISNSTAPIINSWGTGRLNIRNSSGIRINNRGTVPFSKNNSAVPIVRSSSLAAAAFLPLLGLAQRAKGSMHY